MPTTVSSNSEWSAIPLLSVTPKRTLLPGSTVTDCGSTIPTETAPGTRAWIRSPPLAYLGIDLSLESGNSSFVKPSGSDRCQPHACGFSRPPGTFKGYEVFLVCLTAGMGLLLRNGRRQAVNGNW